MNRNAILMSMNNLQIENLQQASFSIKQFQMTFGE